MRNSSIIMYTTEDGSTKIETTFDEDTVWLSIDQMAELFQRDKSTISRHIKNIFEEGELQRNSVVANFATTASDGKTYQVDYYNLDVIISVGYRVKSHRGTQFRIWAMGILKEYMKKGFALDDDRLKRLGGGNYFDELLARIRDIRSSEKVFWRKVLEIYATSIDYDPHAESSVLFFKQVQNKMHWAAHKHTAAEVIYERADAEKENMGLTVQFADIFAGIVRHYYENEPDQKEPETEFQEWLIELFTKLHNLTENNFIPKSHYLEYGFQKMGKNFSYPVSEKFTTSDNDENLLGKDISNDLSE